MRVLQKILDEHDLRKYIGKPHTKDHDWRCRFCGHDVEEHHHTFYPFGQSSDQCYHGRCSCPDFESVYTLSGGLESLEFVSGRWGMDLGVYPYWKYPVNVINFIRKFRRKAIPYVRNRYMKKMYESCRL